MSGRRDDGLREISIAAAGRRLAGFLALPSRRGAGLVVFAHGSGSSRHSPRNQQVAGFLNQAGLGTLLFDLLTPEEENEDAVTRELRFNIPFLANRLAAVTGWLQGELPAPEPLGYFGASTGAAAALQATALVPQSVSAIVSRGGRPDLAGAALDEVTAPTLLIVGGEDLQVLALNQAAFQRLRCRKQLIVVPGATHLFEEPGALEAVARHAREWFQSSFRAADAV